MELLPIYALPANISSIAGLDMFVRWDVLVHQADPLPSTFVLAMPDSQWRLLYAGEPADVARQAVTYVQGMTGVITWDTGVSLEPGLAWELACYQQGWLFQDPPNVFTPANIPIGPQHGMTPSQPNFYIADLLFASGSWQWLLWA